MRELDGCTYLLELQDGSKLQPVTLPVEFQHGGLKVRIKYKKVEIMVVFALIAGYTGGTDLH